MSHIHSKNKHSKYNKISINEILEKKEYRALYREKLIKKYKKPLLVFSFNIPYDKKNSNLINFNFNYIASKIIFALSPITINIKIDYDDIGNALFLVFNDDAIKIKKLFSYLENNTTFGRLLDIDIYNTNNEKLSRKTLRKCFICDKPAFECARNNTHSKKKINEYVNKLLYDNFKEILSDTMTNSLYDELYTTPKPGLVDLNNNGSHKDLNVNILKKSIITISKNYGKVIDTTYHYIKNYDKNVKLDYDNLFYKLQILGKNIEKEMFKTTGNVNTHKGAIYLSILLLSACTINIKSNHKYENINCILNHISDTTKKLVEKNYFKSIKASIKNPTTHGDYVYKEYKMYGPRDEAYNGLKNILNFIKNNFNNFNNLINSNQKKFQKNKDIFLNYLYPILLIHIISKTNDTNLLHRGGINGLKYAKFECMKILKKKSNNIIDNIYSLDKNFIEKNLSPGGCADLLSMTIFLSKISNYYIFH